MTLPKLLYIQTFQVHENFVHFYQQFVEKLVEAHKKMGNGDLWSVFENNFKKVGSVREFIFMREMDSWSNMDDLSKEAPLAKLLVSAYGEKEGLQYLELGRRAIRSYSTEVLSKLDNLSL